MRSELMNAISDLAETIEFSGTVLVKKGEAVLAESGFGLANRSEQIQNRPDTRFGIASGSKLFTAVAICQLAEQGKLSLENKLKDVLAIEFPQFDENITVHQLLTHISGIPDYFDEEVMDDFEELWIKNPMYHIRRLQDFLPMFQNQAMKHSPGSKFHYNNAGYILLGLIIEQASGVPFSEFVGKNIFEKADMKNSGYFEVDALPGRTALGYIDHSDGTWKTNVFSLPAKGGSDGGAYVTAGDMMKLWETLTNFELLNEHYVKQIIAPHVQVNDSTSYGYGLWMKSEDESPASKYILMGYDPGVNFRAAFFPDENVKIIVCSNKSGGAYDLITGIENELNGQK